MDEEMQYEAQELDPDLERFLDAKTIPEKLEILYAMRDKLDEEMLRVICITMDIQLNSTGVKEQYAELRSILNTIEKYECTRNRLRQ